MERRERRDRSPSEEVKNDGTTVYIRNLSRRITEKELQSLLEKFGSVSEVDIVQDPFTRWAIFK
jgi:transformer-2 protein